MSVAEEIMFIGFCLQRSILFFIARGEEDVWEQSSRCQESRGERRSLGSIGSWGLIRETNRDKEGISGLLETRSAGPYVMRSQTEQSWVSASKDST